MFVFGVLIGAHAVEMSVYRSPVAKLNILEQEHFIEPREYVDDDALPFGHHSLAEFSRGASPVPSPSPDGRGGQASATSTGGSITSKAATTTRVASTPPSPEATQAAEAAREANGEPPRKQVVDVVATVSAAVPEVAAQVTDTVNELKHLSNEVDKDVEEVEEEKKNNAGIRNDANDLTTIMGAAGHQLTSLDTTMKVNKVGLTESSEGTGDLKADDHSQGEEMVDTKERLQMLYKRLDSMAATVGLKLNKAAKQMEGLYGWSFTATERINSNTNFLHNSVRSMTSLDNRMGRTINAMIDLMERLNKAQMKAKIVARQKAKEAEMKAEAEAAAAANAAAEEGAAAEDDSRAPDEIAEVAPPSRNVK